MGRKFFQLLYGSDDPLTITAQEAGVTVKLNCPEKAVSVPGLKYRLDSTADWTTYVLDTELTLANAGDYVQFYNEAEVFSTSQYAYVNFVISGYVKASGNIQSLLNYSVECPEFGLLELFSEHCPGLLSAPKMPAPAVGLRGYQGTYFKCINMIDGPSELPATVLGDWCYYYMFSRCDALVKPPGILPATELSTGCYHSMFQLCKSLITPPVLSAVSIADFCCYWMFNQCAVLPRSPVLPAAIPYSRCYNWMFNVCSMLSSIEVRFTSWDRNNESPTGCQTWVNSVNASGTFYKPSALPEEYGVDRIPEGWTVVNID